MFVWRSATRLPTVIDAAARTQNTGCQMSGTVKNPKKTIESSATKPPALDETDRNAVTGVGAPSYVSGAQKWNGTAVTLNAKPDDGEEDRDDEQRLVSGASGSASAMSRQQRGAGDPEDQRHAVEHDRGGEHTDAGST